MVSLKSTVIKPMHPEGRRFVAIFAAASLPLFLLWQPLGWIGVGLTVWCYYFFRDPERFPPDLPGHVFSAADGVVSAIDTAPPPPELDLGDVPLLRISVFMSVFDVHVNRMPVAAVVRRIAYRPGAFVSASLDKASEDNERSSLLLELPDGRKMIVTQIAGLVARRIVTFVGEGMSLEQGERFGLIRFGSRVDHYLPEGSRPVVRVGQRAVAGETPLANLEG
ncbi:phosphatidylserine decarboxylase [Thetidibacter halocola]|uniref:Phosphatidylserine decarboxylase proenzyme n=1 Tax=Thetidibacter halocola TaxID=2827239 RepID=A0A8J7WD31_9RHOB|nr:phosphatidylserine decarboxylase [Thetidibacter halocola]MBS0125362.1 phosphatidylserine decarboxylase [Thetidibacter halocola]